jgi:hypothetical protein
MHLPRLTAVAVLSAALSACSSSTQSLPPAGTGAATSMETWHRSLAQNKLPGAGCFEATYPSLDWSRIACSAPPNVMFPPRSRQPHLGQLVGDSHDFTIDTTPHIVSTAMGAFPKVTGVKSVQSGGSPGAYTLQLNSNFFPSAACGSLQNCVGWSQFAYGNFASSNEGTLFIQDWLVATKGSFSSCPPGQGWNNAGIGCYQNSPFSVSLPRIDVTKLASVVLTGDADPSGDSIYISVGKKAYGMKNVQGDGITDLSQHWQGAEFNVIGDGGGDEAMFNSGSKITVSIQADDGIKAKPKCPPTSGTTGETNNLFLVKAPPKAPELQYPSIEFTMSSKFGAKATCDVEKAK